LHTTVNDHLSTHYRGFVCFNYTYRLLCITLFDDFNLIISICHWNPPWDRRKNVQITDNSNYCQNRPNLQNHYLDIIINLHLNPHQCYTCISYHHLTHVSIKFAHFSFDLMELSSLLFFFFSRQRAPTENASSGSGYVSSAWFSYRWRQRPNLQNHYLDIIINLHLNPHQCYTCISYHHLTHVSITFFFV
jgi:hypothetical protein